MTKTLKWRLGSARIWIAAFGIAVALAVAACGGTSSGQHRAPAAGGPGGPSVALASSTLGKILVDAKGQTLYLFQADKGTASTCNGACATAWPPLTTTGKPTVGPGLTASKLGTTKRSDGSTEVTYNGHPLYTFVGDSAPGQTTGQGTQAFGAAWYVLSTAGSKVTMGASMGGY
jgi:predicted lipoprotein with Yx(FWY)xxD motif